MFSLGGKCVCQVALNFYAQQCFLCLIFLLYFPHAILTVLPSLPCEEEGENVYQGIWRDGWSPVSVL